VEIYGQTFARKAITPKMLYGEIIKDNYLRFLKLRMEKWVPFLDCDSNFLVKNMMPWTKGKYVDGFTRDIHFKTVNFALYTRSRTSLFSDTPFFCKLCRIKGVIVREDIPHVLIYCPRAVEMYGAVSNLLRDLAGTDTISLLDLIFGKKLPQRKNFITFNYIVQTAQRAIWQARNNLEMDKEQIHPVDIFRTVTFRNLCRQKVAMKEEKFFSIFGPLVERTNTPLQFRLKIW
jgi:hypothetical protein